MRKEGCLAMGVLEHPHSVVHFCLLERKTEDNERFLVRQRDRTSAISGSPPGDGVSIPHIGGFLWIINLLLCLKCLERESP